ncbi:hypothetical protein PVAP13_4KG052500 [Panicum virgatum]|uniref:Uncharacterized protein n=1 Tax=Panicum virgatum TaxID=38727 RepID=A0A8T0TIV7_PANVG|nr:hypothetical protein PVAP13_4KG052500 [Panicum virgatum]
MFSRSLLSYPVHLCHELGARVPWPATPSSPPRRVSWRRIGPGGASRTRRKAHERRAGSGSLPPGSRPADGPPLGRRVIGGGGPSDSCPPAGMARIHQVAPHAAASRRRVRMRVMARSRSRPQSTAGGHQGTNAAHSSSATAASSSGRGGAAPPPQSALTREKQEIIVLQGHVALAFLFQTFISEPCLFDVW